MRDYHLMIDEVLKYGSRKENRTGVDTISTFNYNYELSWTKGLQGSNTTFIGAPSLVGDDPDPRGPVASPIPLLTTKDVSWKNIVVEMLWFLSGDPTIEILQRHGCKFWDAWADADGKVPMAYGEQWRRFPTHEGPLRYESGGVSMELPRGAPSFNDQIAWVLDQLRKNPMNRRLVVSAWAPGIAQTAKLPPCHMVFAFNVQNVDLRNSGLPPGPREQEERVKRGLHPYMDQHLCLHLTQRSCDLALGVPYNMASYGLLLLIFSHLTGIKPGIFAHTLLDLHIYCDKPDGSMAEYNHIPGLKEQREREPRELPTLTIDPSIKELSDIEALMGKDVSTEDILAKFKLDGYSPHPAIKFKVAV